MLSKPSAANKTARHPRVWIETPVQPSDTGKTIELPKRSAHHLLKVLRAKSGDTIEAFNGDGHNYHATLTVDGKALMATIQAVSENQSESTIRTLLIQSIARGDRTETSLQKSVELGVNAIQPVYTQHSIPPLKADRATRKTEHWQAIAISAAEQSGRSTVPTVHPASALNTWLQDTWPKLSSDGYTGWVLAPSAIKGFPKPRSNATDDVRDFAKKHAVLIGPETGLTAEEIQNAVDAGFQAIRFGPRILRTETAGPAVLSTLQALYGDLLA
jgi:16S rRNA (uracil1498-N3)-methyltransferase